VIKEIIIIIIIITIIIIIINVMGIFSFVNRMEAH